MTWFLKAFKSLFYKHNMPIFDSIDDDKSIDEYIANRKRNLQLFDAIIGDTPMKQIDWLINNGFEKYNYWYNCMISGDIYSPATVEKRKEEVVVIDGRGITNNNGITIHHTAGHNWQNPYDGKMFHSYY